ncbi:PP2C family protein-serine/threonine phosphatase [Streptomyces sp. NPDC004539]|uniref:PP2C family protein-serine/threonine phosphatase n=1 Tax=Streptomyces sp. NPDC004539 TaxID=3154280 RepID=UPI0033BF3006
MNAPHPPKVAGIDSTVPAPAHTASPVSVGPPAAAVPLPATAPTCASGPGVVLQDRLAGWVSDLTTLHELTERLSRTDALPAALDELLRAGAALLGARRGLVVLEPASPLDGPATTTALGLDRADLGHLETVPRAALPHALLLDGRTGRELRRPDLLAEPDLDPRHREVAARLGYAAVYGVTLNSLTAEGGSRYGDGTPLGRLTGRGSFAEADDRGVGGGGPGTGTGAATAADGVRGTGGPEAPGGPGSTGVPGAARNPGTADTPDLANRPGTPGTTPLGSPGTPATHPLPGAPDVFASLGNPALAAGPGVLHTPAAPRAGVAGWAEAPRGGFTGAVVWFYDEAGEPDERRRHLVELYARFAAAHVGRLSEVEHTRACIATIAEELLPSRLPRVAGMQLAVRHRSGARGGGDWYDALPLPDAALGLSVGSVTGSGPSPVAAMGRLRASLRAYAVMEGEDPVAVLSDLELLLRLTEPARSATALFAYCEPALRKLTLAGAGHCPPLLVGDRRTEFVETSVSAPLGMLSCWEAPSVELEAEPGETVLLYTDGLLRRTGESMDRAFSRLHSAAAGVPKALRGDPGAIADHVLRAMLPGGADGEDRAEDVVLLAARFE